MTPAKILIPESALTKHIAILGMNGSGKTSVAKSQIIEPALAAGHRVCNIDPAGAGWGLRLAADGKRKGFQIYIVGGEHQDFPLQQRDGETWADIVGTTSDSFVFDTSQMTVSARSLWFTDFAENLLRKNKGPLRLVIDEAHLFAPKSGASGGGVVPAMLHATNNLISLGRGRGIRAAMLTQRPAKLHNDTLTQAHTLLAMSLIAPHDRNAVKDWIEDQASMEQGNAIITSLPTLRPGQGWLWAPREKILECIQFPRPITFDSSAAPEDMGEQTVALPPINPQAISAKLAVVAKEKIANDPSQLRARIAELERQAAKTAPADPTTIHDARMQGMTDAYVEMNGIVTNIKTTIANIQHIADDLRTAIAAIGGISIPGPVPKLSDIVRDIAFAPPATPRAESSGDQSMPKGERAILIGAAMHRDGITREHLTVLTGYKRSSRDTYIQRLTARGHIELRNARFTATPAGIASLGSDYAPLPTGDRLQAHVLENLPEGEAKVLLCAIKAYPRVVLREEIDNETGYKRSSRDTYIQRLSVRELVTTERGAIRASEHLFG